MDVVPSIWLSSVTGALLFFTGGRLWGKALALQEALDPLIHGHRERRDRAEQEARAAARERDEVARVLEEERAGSAALRAEIAALIEARAEAQREAERRREQAVQATVAREEAQVEIERLSRIVDLQGIKVARLRAEAEATRRQESEIPRRPTARPPRPTSAHRLETAIEAQLDALRVHEDGCRTAILADMRGLLLASSGDTVHDDDLAAAASVTTDTTERLRQLLSLGEPLEIRLTDVNQVVFTARWLHADQDALLLSTLGVTSDKIDPRAAIGASITDLVRST